MALNKLSLKKKSLLFKTLSDELMAGSNVAKIRKDLKAAEQHKTL